MSEISTGTPRSGKRALTGSTLRTSKSADHDPGRFAGWTVESAKRCVIEEVGADSAIELPGALGEFGGQGGFGVSVGEADSAASWDNAEAAQEVFFNSPPESSCFG